MITNRLITFNNTNFDTKNQSIDEKSEKKTYYNIVNENKNPENQLNEADNSVENI